MRIFSDNKGAELSTEKGRARAWDHSAVVHSIWMKAAKIGCFMWVERVPTKENISDLPSRQRYQLLKKMRARFVAPVLDGAFHQPEAWEALSLRSIAGGLCEAVCSTVCDAPETSAVWGHAWCHVPAPRRCRDHEACLYNVFVALAWA